MQSSTAASGATGGTCAYIGSTMYANGSSYIVATAFSYTNQADARVGIITNAVNTGSDIVAYRFLGQQNTYNSAGFLSFLNDGCLWVANNTYQGAVSTPYTMVITDNAGSWSGSLYSGYGAENTVAVTTMSVGAYGSTVDCTYTPTGYVGVSAGYYNSVNTLVSNPATFQWFYMRQLPPSNTMPTVAIGSLVSC